MPARYDFLGRLLPTAGRPSARPPRRRQAAGHHGLRGPRIRQHLRQGRFRAVAFVCRIQWQLQQRKRAGALGRRAATASMPVHLRTLACSTAFLNRAGAPRAFEAAKRRMNPTASDAAANLKPNTTSLHRCAATNSRYTTPPLTVGGLLRSRTGGLRGPRSRRSIARHWAN